jgi:hypothetical protein
VPFADPYAALPSQDQFPTFVNGVSIAGQVFDRQLRTPYVQQYNAGVQYELSRDLLFEVTFASTRGLNLIRSVGINQSRLASPQSPIINAVNGRVITTNTADATNVSLRAPYQGVEVGGFLQIQSTAQSTYNSLQMSLTRRFAKGLQFLASYTFGKSIDNSSGTNGGSADAVRDTAIILGNQLNNRANRGLSDFDRTHRLVMNFLWELPHPSFAAKSRIGRMFFADWQIAGVVTRNVRTSDRHRGRWRRFVLWIEQWQQSTRTSKLGARRYVEHSKQQRSRWIFLQPLRLCPAGRSCGATYP